MRGDITTVRRRWTVRCGRSTRGGFTLIELVVVLLILGITAGVAVPAFTSLGDADERTHGANAVVTLLRSARLAAVTRGTTVTLTVDPASGRYWAAVERDVADGTGHGSLAEGVLALGPDARLIATVPRLRFTFGPTGGGFGDSVVVQDHAHASTIAVDRWTGDAVVVAP